MSKCFGVTLGLNVNDTLDRLLTANTKIPLWQSLISGGLYLTAVRYSPPEIKLCQRGIFVFAVNSLSNVSLTFRPSVTPKHFDILIFLRANPIVR